MNITELEKDEAVGIGGCTLVGYMSNNFPMRSGNCFTVVNKEGKDYKIANFGHEDLEEAMRRGITFPIPILILAEGVAVIHDPRIPDDWYWEGFCGICTPNDLLSTTSKLAHQRGIECGAIKEEGSWIHYNHENTPTLPDPDEKPFDPKTVQNIYEVSKKSHLYHYLNNGQHTSFMIAKLANFIEHKELHKEFYKWVSDMESAMQKSNIKLEHPVCVCQCCEGIKHRDLDETVPIKTTRKFNWKFWK